MSVSNITLTTRWVQSVLTGYTDVTLKPDRYIHVGQIFSHQPVQMSVSNLTVTSWRVLSILASYADAAATLADGVLAEVWTRIRAFKTVGPRRTF